MPLIDAIDLYEDAKKKGYAVGAFDTDVGNPDFIMSILGAASDLGSPVVIQGAAGPLSELYDIRAFGRSISSLAQDNDAKVILHLNQATEIDQIRTALDSGFNSVMITGGQRSLSKNIELTRKAVELAEVYNAAVEGKLGTLGGKEEANDVSQHRTDLKEAVKYVKETGIDIIAPSIGTVYGVYTESPDLDFKLLKQLSEKLDIGMVIHGASGLNTRDYRSLIDNGAVKINVSTAMRTTYIDNIKSAMESGLDTTLPYKITSRARGEIKKTVIELMRIFKGQWD